MTTRKTSEQMLEELKQRRADTAKKIGLPVDGFEEMLSETAEGMRDAFEEERPTKNTSNIEDGSLSAKRATKI